MRNIINERHLLMFTKTDQYSEDFGAKSANVFLCVNAGSPKFVNGVKVMLLQF